MIRLILSRRSTATNTSQSKAPTEFGPTTEFDGVTVETAASLEGSDADEQPVQSDTGQDATNIESAESAAGDGSFDGGECPSAEMGTKRKRFCWRATVVYLVLPGLVMLLAVAVGFLRWKDSTVHESDGARIESVRAATDSAIKMLSYKPDSVESDLTSARDRMTGSFRDAYTQLIHDVVIPGAKQKGISAMATVPAAASVSASPSHAVVLAFINQTIIVGDDPPSSTASSVRVALDRVGDRWLISDFTPV